MYRSMLTARDNRQIHFFGHAEFMPQARRTEVIQGTLDVLILKTLSLEPRFGVKEQLRAIRKLSAFAA